MLYIIYYKTDYIDFIFKGVNSSLPVEFIELNHFRSLINRILIRIIPAWFPNIPNCFINRELRNKLNLLESTDSILVLDYSDNHLLNAIKKSVKQTSKLFFWAWNPIKIDGFSFIKKIKELGYLPFTFEPKDAERFQIGLLHQFYRMKLDYQENEEYKYDFYFIGFIKNRSREIEELRSLLINEGFSVCFHVVQNVDQVIPYEQSLINYRYAKCLVELVEDGLEGITLRPLEALALRKKMITNNTEIINEEFYNPNNIFVLELDNINRLGEFLNSEFIDIDMSVLLKYDVNEWIRFFLKSN